MRKYFIISRKKLNIGVCGPALYYYQEDFSFRLIEWLELMREMGVSRVYLYDAGVHPNIQQVFRFYEEVGFVIVKLFDYPPPYLNIPSLRRQVSLSSE